MNSRKQQLLHINSRYRIQPKTTNSAQFTISLGNESKLAEVKAVVLKEVEIVNSFYNVDKYNNRLYFTTLSTEDYIEIPRGQYNINQLITALVSAFAAKTITVLITIDNLTNLLSFNFSQATALYKYRTNDEFNPMADILGLQNSSYAEVLSYTAQGIPDLCGVKAIYIYSSQLSQGMGINSKGFSNSLLGVIHNDVGFGEVIYMEKETPDTHIYDDTTLMNLNTISIELRDCNDNLLIPNGHDINMTIKIFH